MKPGMRIVSVLTKADSFLNAMNYGDRHHSNKYRLDTGRTGRIRRFGSPTCFGQRQNRSIASVSRDCCTFRSYVFEESSFSLKTPLYDHIYCTYIQILAFYYLVLKGAINSFLDGPRCPARTGPSPSRTSQNIRRTSCRHSTSA